MSDWSTDIEDQFAALQLEVDSLTLELEAERHAHRKDNEYLLGLRDEARKVIEALAEQQAMPDDFYLPTLEKLRGTP